MSFVTDLQDFSDYHGGDYRELPRDVKAELIASYVRSQPVLEPIYAMPDRSVDYLLRDVLADIIEHSHNPTGERYRRAVNALIGGLVLGVMGHAERKVEEMYDAETAPPMDHSMQTSDFVEVRRAAAMNRGRG
jgi:hypothetical protein